MNRLYNAVLDPHSVALIGLAALAGVLVLGLDAFDWPLPAVGGGLALVAFVAALAWALRRRRRRRAGQAFGEAIERDAVMPTPKGASTRHKADLDALRTRLLAAVRTIRSSKLGETSGAAALYELPWYVVIGNPAAGKSTAILESGLKFPFADSAGSVVQGLGGTRNCDWFFTNEGILLDTAGRYSVEGEDRAEWLGFLSLLKRHRPKAPINGVVIAASLAELSQARPDAAIELAKNLRQRVQELTERLEVFAPVYLVFTKADLLSGFADMFRDCDPAERDKVWGATLPYDPDARADAAAQFDHHFDALREGLKALSRAQLSLRRGQPSGPGALSFPIEFGALQPALRSFVATLFEDNPYQFRPIFRGFYFTSAIQEGVPIDRATGSVATRFALGSPPTAANPANAPGHGFFLRQLFSRVIFADRELVRRFSSRGKVRARAATFAVAALALALALGGWSWSALANRHLVADVRADLDKAIRLQRDRVDLASRLEALEVLQDRIEQLAAWRANRPLALGLGLYQGEAIETRLRGEYFAGVRQVMVQPVAQAIEAYLVDMNANAGRLQPMARPPESAAPSLSSAADAPARFAEASPQSVEDAYNALKTYLMLADPARREPGHLTDQITRFWRGWLEQNRGTMPNEQMIRSAERMISFAMANVQDPAFPSVANNLGLVDQARENLRRVARGAPARDRIYAEVKARAATRFAQVTVARVVGDADRSVVSGSYAVPGTFTREAWKGYVEGAFRDASTRELQTVDWVLKTSAADDLTLQGSPDQIRKALTERYKADYAREWQRFMQGIVVSDFGALADAVPRINRLGDPSDSPIRKLVTVLVEQTTWDNPSPLGERLAEGRRGALEWVRQVVLRQAPAAVNVDLRLGAGAAEAPLGPLGREFAALSRITVARDHGPTLLAGYLEALGKLRSRFNQIRTQGDAGPAARQMMAATLEGGPSELGEALKFVDEQMLVGASDGARTALRPLLVRPLIQAFAALVAPTEDELNRTWNAQVAEPYRRTLADKYPFDTASRVEATPQDIAKIFGPAGAVARFGSDALGPLVVRRGDTVTPRTWADLGLRLRPDFIGGFAGWVAPLEGAAGGAGATAASASQTTFQILPIGAPGLKEYVVEIDGQVLRYRNAAPVWTTFVWPNPGGPAGSRISAVTTEDRTVAVFDEPGRFSLERLFEAATRTRLADGVSELRWTRDGASVALQLRVVSAPAPAATGPAPSGKAGRPLPSLVAGIDASSAPEPADAASAVLGRQASIGTNR